MIEQSPRGDFVVRHAAFCDSFISSRRPFSLRFTKRELLMSDYLDESEIDLEFPFKQTLGSLKTIWFAFVLLFSIFLFFCGRRGRVSEFR